MNDGERLRERLATARLGLTAMNDQLRQASAERVRQAVQLAAMRAVSETLGAMKAEAEQGGRRSAGSGAAHALALEAAMAEADRLLALLNEA